MISGKINWKLRAIFFKYTLTDPDQQLMSTFSSSSFITDDESTNPSTTLSKARSSDDFDYFHNMLLSSSPLTTFSDVLFENVDSSTDDFDRLSPKPSQASISNKIIVSRLPFTINSRRLRAFFPGCCNITFKKNYWNKDFRLDKYHYQITAYTFHIW
jgi:hypothetical protein